MTARKLVKIPRCVVCNHVDRVRIEFAHVSGASLDSIAAQFKVSRDAVWRHCQKHLTDNDRSEYLAAVPLKELAEKAAVEGMSVLEHLSIVRATLMRQFQLAASVNDRQGTATLAGRLTECLRAIGQLTGELGSMVANNLTINNTTNILNSPVFANLQANLLTALAPYTDARAAVVQALRQMDDQKELPMKTIEHTPVAECATSGALGNAAPTAIVYRR
jgi:hypothetical protein